MTGTAKQIKWAEDIKEQVMDAAHEAYEGSMEKKWGMTFEQSKAGHAAIFATENADDAKFWIDSIGYAIVDYNRRDEVAKSRGDLENIITSMMVHFTHHGAEGMGLYEQYMAEEDTLSDMRVEARKAAWAARKAAKAAARAAQNA